MSDNLISINNLSKIYDNGFEALKNINLDIKKGEIFAMLGPNGAGKTTLISIVCGIVKPSSGKVSGFLPVPVTITLIPFFANTNAVDLPIPLYLPAPVTIATFDLLLNLLTHFLYLCRKYKL